MGTKIEAQIADAVAALWDAETAARAARVDAGGYSCSVARFESSEGIAARERLKSANWAVGAARARRDELIARLHAETP